MGVEFDILIGVILEYFLKKDNNFGFFKISLREKYLFSVVWLRDKYFDNIIVWE